VYGERGNVGGDDDTADRERGAELVAPFLELIAEQ
jgi:hypothetical protein